jgi:hypothetical protein
MTQSHDHEFRKGGFRPPDQPVALLKGVSRGHFYAQLNAAPEACFLGLRGSTPRNNFLYLIPGLVAHTTLSDSRQGRRRSATLRSLPSPMTGLPRLPESPFRRAVPTTPAERTGACVDCFPAHAAFPKWQEGRLPHCHFRVAHRRTADPRWMKLSYHACALSAQRSVLVLGALKPVSELDSGTLSTPDCATGRQCPRSTFRRVHR